MALLPIPRPLPAPGFVVPVDRIDSSFRLWGFLPGHSHNDVSPQLVLYPGRLAIKVMTTAYHEYTALRQVDYQPEGFLRRAAVVLRFADHTAYAIKPSSAAVTHDLLRFCHERALPLTPAARQAARMN